MRVHIPSVIEATVGQVMTVQASGVVSMTTPAVGVGTGDMEMATYDPDEDGVIAVAQGGTGATTASGARTALGLGTASTSNAGDFDAAGAAAAAQAASLPLHGTADDSAKLGGTTPSTYGKSIIDDADAATARGTLGLGTAAVLNDGSVTPAAHASTHEDGGADAVKIGTLNAPTLDITIAAGYSVFIDDEYTIADGKEVAILDGGSLTIL